MWAKKANLKVRFTHQVAHPVCALLNVLMSILRVALRLLLAVALAGVFLPTAKPAAALDAATFVARTSAWAQAEERESGVPASVAMAQAILESGWGESSLTKKAKNWFGIKCFSTASKWQKGCYEIKTKEFDSAGNEYTTTAKFRNYETDQNSFIDHGLFLKGLSRYAKAFNHTNNPDRFIVEVHLGGYATDPQYANKVIDLMARHNLYQYNVTAPATGASQLTIRPQTLANVGATANVTGLLSPGGAGVELLTQVSTSSGWSTDQRVTTGKRGQFTIPLTYGTNTAGPTTYRVITASGQLTSPEFTVERKGPAPSKPVTWPHTVKRTEGEDRYATAVSISKAEFTSAPVVFVAAGSDYPDALSAAPVAAKHNGPLLLSDKDSLLPAVAEEIKRLKPTQIVVVGGSGALSDAVLSDLGRIAATVRISGSDRYETSLRINTDATYGFEAAPKAYVATGTAFPDALSASAAGAAVGAPVILVRGSAMSLDAATQAELSQLGVKQTIISGGTGAISTGVENGLKAATGVAPDRRGGSDRYETSRLIGTDVFPPAKNVFLATGEDFPDALAGGVVTGRNKGPLYLVKGTCVPKSTLSAITAVKPPNITLFGGTGVLNNDVATLKPCA